MAQTLEQAIANDAELMAKCGPVTGVIVQSQEFAADGTAHVVRRVDTLYAVLEEREGDTWVFPDGRWLSRFP